MVEEITPEELHAKIQADEDVQVVDIRPAREFRRGHVPGAINLPFSEFSRRIDEVEWGDEIVVACPIGQSSVQAARMLEAYEGVDGDARVANLDGGYEAYDYPLESSGD